MGLFRRKEKETAPVDTMPTGIGWRLATFALERLEPKANCLFTLSEAWDAYCGWCASREEEPMAIAFFDREFGRLARETGIERIQNGANVYFLHVVLKGRT